MKQILVNTGAIKCFQFRFYPYHTEINSMIQERILKIMLPRNWRNLILLFNLRASFFLSSDKDKFINIDTCENEQNFIARVLVFFEKNHIKGTSLIRKHYLETIQIITMREEDLFTEHRSAQ